MKNAVEQWAMCSDVTAAGYSRRILLEHMYVQEHIRKKEVAEASQKQHRIRKKKRERKGFLPCSLNLYYMWRLCESNFIDRFFHFVVGAQKLLFKVIESYWYASTSYKHTHTPSCTRSHSHDGLVYETKMNWKAGSYSVALVLCAQKRIAWAPIACLPSK